MRLRLPLVMPKTHWYKTKNTTHFSVLKVSKIMPSVAIGTALAGLIGAGINAASTYATNRENISNQNAVNAEQLRFASNAYSIATRDRLRAGLSPLDTQAAQSPALTAPVSQPTDAGSLISDSVNNAVVAHQRNKEIENQTVVSNAQAASYNADAALKAVDLRERIAGMQDRLSQLKERTEQEKFKTSTQEELYNKQIEKLEEDIRVAMATFSDLINQSTMRTHSTAANMVDTVNRGVATNAQASKTVTETKKIVAETKQTLWDYVKNKKMDLRSSDSVNGFVNGIRSIMSEHLHLPLDFALALAEEYMARVRDGVPTEQNIEITMRQAEIMREAETYGAD